MKQQMRMRISCFCIVTIVLFAALILRLFWVQIVLGEGLSKEARQLQTKEITSLPQRGYLFDRNHNQLVTNVAAFNIYANPNLIKSAGETASKIAPLLGQDPQELVKEFNANKDFVWLKHQVDLNTKEKLQQMNLPGIGALESSARAYPQGNLAANLLGVVGNDNQGLEGIEKYYDHELSGIPGKMLFQTDAQGRLLPQTEQLVSPTRQGDQLILTIDQTIQFYAEQELNKIASLYHPKKGLILVMDPNTDELLAMSSWPGFDPAHWQDAPSSSWEQNPATFFSYEPGSVFKIFVTAAALESGVVQPGEYFYDPGYMVIQGHQIHDAEIKKYGEVTLEQGMADSLNVVFTQIAQRLGPHRLLDYARKFGFGSPTGIDLPGEESGILMPEKEVIPLSLAEMSFGQSIAVTSIQVLTAVSAIANEGKLLRPHVLKAVEDQSGKVIKEFVPGVARQVISAQTAHEVTALLEKTVQDGTGQKALVSGFKVAGKTGTAQVPGPKGYLPGKYISSFVGFAPADKPKVSVLVIVDEPQGEYYGGTVAAPFFSELMGKIMNYMNVPPQIPQITGSDEQSRVPNVINFPVASARKLLEDNGMDCRSPGETGIVVAQQPEAGQLVNNGTEIELKTLQKNDRDVAMPDLRGLSIKEAASVIEGLGLAIHIEGSGIVAKQSIMPNTSVARGSIVTLEFVPPT